MLINDMQFYMHMRLKWHQFDCCQIAPPTLTLPIICDTSNYNGKFDQWYAFYMHEGKMVSIWLQSIRSTPLSPNCFVIITNLWTLKPLLVLVFLVNLLLQPYHCHQYYHTANSCKYYHYCCCLYYYYAFYCKIDVVVCTRMACASSASSILIILILYVNI